MFVSTREWVFYKKYIFPYFILRHLLNPKIGFDLFLMTLPPSTAIPSLDLMTDAAKLGGFPWSILIGSAKRSIHWEKWKQTIGLEACRFLPNSDYRNLLKWIKFYHSTIEKIIYMYSNIRMYLKWCKQSKPTCNY